MVQGELSRGGMGITYTAKLQDRGRLVVIKTLLPEHEFDPNLVNRFREEIRSLIKLEKRHPNVVVAYHEGEEVSAGHTLPFVVMEYIEGQGSPQGARRQGPALPIAEACDYTRQVAKGLGHLLEEKMIHRDIKPSNIILRKGDGEDIQAVIVDLGLALDIDGDSQLTVLGQPLGTPDYMAPEAATDPHRGHPGRHL